VRNIIAGQDERLNWVLLNEYINDCLPIPGKRLEAKIKTIRGNEYTVTDREGRDHPPANQPPFRFDATSILGKNGQPITRADSLKQGDEVTIIYNDSLSGAAAKYWNRNASDAYRKISERQPPVKGQDGRTEEDKIDSLIQVNIESIYPVYCNDLKAYFTQLKEDMKKGGKQLDLMLTQKEKESDPEGKGWVVEIRGYTYHKERNVFLLNTFHRDLQTRGAKAEEKKEGTPPPTPPVTQPTDKPVAPKELTPAQEKAFAWDKVIAGRISYVVLYDFATSQPMDVAGNFELINASVVGRLAASQPGTPGGTSSESGVPASGGEKLTAAVPSGGGPTSALPGGPGGSAPGKTGTAGSWAPLTGIDAGGGGGSISSGGGFPGAAMDRPTAFRPPGGTAAPATEGPSRPAPADSQAKAGPKRVEFIILFVWKEPTPSDDRKEDSANGQGQTPPQATSVGDRRG